MINIKQKHPKLNKSDLTKKISDKKMIIGCHLVYYGCSDLHADRFIRLPHHITGHHHDKPDKRQTDDIHQTTIDALCGH
jgi:hypothetical protein